MVIPYYYPSRSYGGPLYSVKALAEYLSLDKNYEVTILTSNLDGNKKIYDSDTCKIINNVTIYYFGIDTYNLIKKNLFGFFYSSSLKKYLKYNIKKFDIVHSQINFNYFSYISLYYAQKYNIVNFFSQRGTYSPKRIMFKYLKKKLYLILERRLASKAHCLIALDKEEKRNYIKLGYKNKITIIKNGIKVFSKNNNNFYNKKIDDKKINIVFLSRIHTLKGIHILIQSIRLHSKSLTNFNFFICGYDEENFFKYQNLDDIKKINIHYMGNLDDSKKFDLLYKTDALILPSYGEGLSVALLEALSCGNLILTSNYIKFSRETFEIKFSLSVNGIFQALKKLEKLKNDRRTYKKLRISAKEYVRINYNWEDAANKYKELINSFF
jgi:glycosyltransferase involved in cell wall biosynthesis